MTVSTTNNRIAYTGNGVTTVFNFPYKFLATSDIKVYVSDALEALTTDYAVGTPSDSGANITFTVAPANVASVVMYSDPDLLQSTDLLPNDPFPADSLEKMVDKVTLQIQRLSDRVNRSLRVPDSDVNSPSSVPIESIRSGKLLSFNATTGDPECVVPAEQSASALAILLSSSDGTSSVGHYYSEAPAYLKLLSDIANGSEVSIDRWLTQSEINDARASGAGYDLSIPFHAAFNVAKNILIPSGLYCFENMITASGRDCNFYGPDVGSAILKYVGAGSPAAVVLIDDTPNVSRVAGLYFDAGGNAKNGLLFTATTVVNSKALIIDRVSGGNTASDPINLNSAVIQVLASGGAGSSIRPKNIFARGLRTYTCGTHGFLPAYCDGVNIFGGSRFENAANHGWEAVRCTNVKANNWHSEACGKSGGGVGDGTIGFQVFNFSANLCAGDGVFTVEHNCQDGSVYNFNLTNCFHSAVNVSYGSSSNGNVNVKDIYVFNGQATAHVSNTTTPGVNCYGTSGAGMSDNVNIFNVTVDGFNRGADYLFQKNGKCDISFKNPTGSGTYVVKGQLVINCDIEGKCDYTVSDNAYQIISFSGLDSSDCRIVGHVKQAGATSNMAVVTIDGAGTGFVVTSHTGGANNYIYLQSGASVVLCNSTGPLNGDPWGGVCNPVGSYGNAINSMDFSVMGGKRIFSAANNAGSPNFTAHIPPNTTPYFRDGDISVPVAYSSGTPREWRYKLSVTSWVSQGNFV